MLALEDEVNMVMGQYLGAVEGMNEHFTLVGGGRELSSCLVVQKSDCRKPDTILFTLSNEGLVDFAIGAISCHPLPMVQEREWEEIPNPNRRAWKGIDRNDCNETHQHHYLEVEKGAVGGWQSNHALIPSDIYWEGTPFQSVIRRFQCG